MSHHGSLPQKCPIAPRMSHSCPEMSHGCPTMPHLAPGRILHKYICIPYLHGMLSANAPKTSKNGAFWGIWDMGVAWGRVACNIQLVKRCKTLHRPQPFHSGDHMAGCFIRRPPRKWFTKWFTLFHERMAACVARHSMRSNLLQRQPKPIHIHLPP
jgi:hypothetical protein